MLKLKLRFNHKNIIFSGLIALAIVVRILALLQLKETPYFTFLLYDEKVFHTWASKIAASTFLSQSAYEFAPLYPYLMAGMYWFFSADIVYIRVLNILLGTLGCCLIYILGKDLGGKKTGLFSCLIAAIYAPFILFSIVPLKAMLVVCLFTGLMIVFLRMINQPSLKGFFLGGILLGLLLNVRPQMIVLVPALPVLAMIFNVRNNATTKVYFCIAIFLSGAALAVSPFAVRNYLVTGRLALSTSQSGFNLYRAHKLDHPVPVNFAVTDPLQQETQFIIEASRRSGKKLSASEASRFWRDETIQLFLDHPTTVLKNTIQKIVIFFQQHQMTDHYHIEFMSRYLGILKLPLPGFGFLMPLGMAGLLMLIQVRRKEMVILGAVFVIYAATMILFFVRTRYRLPLMAILIPAAVMGIEYCISMIRARRIKQVAAYLILVGCFAIVGYLPVQRFSDITAYLNGHALALNDAGKSSAAVDTWKESSKMNGLYSDFANLSLAGYYLKKKEYMPVWTYLGKISDSSYAAAQKYLLIGEMMLFQQNLEAAAEAFEKSLSYNSGQMLPLKRLVKIYYEIDREKSYQAYYRLKAIESYYPDAQ